MELPWTEHFIRHGFAVRKGLVDRDYCAEALARVKTIVGNDRPLREWSTDNTPVLHRPFFQGATQADPVLEKIYGQSRLLAAIEELFGGTGHWDGERNYYLFVKPYNPAASATLTPRGHIDFPGQEVPILYRGFTWQVALSDTEPFSGNLTVHPGTHRVIQRALMADPSLQLPKGTSDLPMTDPFEFVAGAGDVLFMHHLVFHSGNESHSTGRLPRVALHGEAFRKKWLARIDPSRPSLSPWEQSLALNGPHATQTDVEHENMKKRRAYVDDLRLKEAKT